MNRQTFLSLWDHFREANGIAMRLIETLPSDKIDVHPIPKMRTPKELLVHLYGQLVKNVAEGIASGEIKEFDEKGAVARIKTKDDLVRFCNDCWNAADQAAHQVTDANLAAMAKTPWGYELPGAGAWGVINDEFFHHRGQLFCFLRSFGVDVPFMWDFEHNAPSFKPKAPATA